MKNIGLVKCSLCNETVRRNTKRVPLLPLPAEGAFDRVAVDVLGLFKQSEKITRSCEAFPVLSEEANTIAHLLVDEIIDEITASNFLFKLVARVCKMFQIRKVTEHIYLSPANRRTCREILFNSLPITFYECGQKSETLDDFIPLILFAYQTSISETTGNSPFYCWYGHQPRLSIDVKFLPPAVDNFSTSVSDHRKCIVEKVQLAQNLAWENIQRSQHKMKKYYDFNASQPLFEIGHVWV